MKKQLFFSICMILALTILSACSSSAEGNDEKLVKLGVSSADGPVWDLLVEKAKSEGINLEIIELVDWQLPNDALVNGEIDINAFQHLAFLSQYNVQRDANLVPIGSSFVGPKGLYSEKYNEISEIPNGASVAISNDPANMGLDLSLLESAGLIELKDGVGIFGTTEDVTNNPKKLEINAMNAQQTPRALEDVALSAIYNSIAGRAGIDPNNVLYENDPLSIEGLPYVNVFAVRAEDVENETYKKVATLIQDPEIKEAYKKDTAGQGEVVDVSVKDLKQTLERLMNE
ncbi:MetQ/NlpA family ABC transporter substrate-binding protein [Aquibacillus sp. 3ASR75-11]|uniref:MetQ/NlpA family ABC transporter substrate-binding protein n=1 Tax=Terrihalobacillus insolitus TaxID=2950438 RepID=A0A9X4AN32_9BACI|nr:MetQ/NlpA family ABC transporter substrate-binding protein [Terrihalobacillus insolitus]MDC3414030.1 MetQ/NlpA family ABC transporter substrate-binding protein [Terrihalobacillus insolitus]MDC3424120.1 MetQ/NlpA family ABC transporter substrate-binding protein [Terrihalobacillus insolitus]